MANILANVNKLYSRQIRQWWYDWPGELLKQVRPYKWLRLLANFLQSLRLLNNQFAEFLVNPLLMLRILTNSLANFANAYERLTNETTTQRMRGETPCQCFPVSLLFARLSWLVKIVLFVLHHAQGRQKGSWRQRKGLGQVWRQRKWPTNRNRFALFVMDSQAFATFCLHSYGWMLPNPYECLTITTHALPSIRIYCDCLRKCCQNNKNMLS